MKEYRVKSFSELHDVLGNQRRDAGWIYRGHPDPDWPLVPRAGRPPFKPGHDEIFFQRWKTEAAQFLENAPGNDWEWLAIAQHHGFVTRLLDWTFKPLAAAFFATFEPGVGESVIYCLKTRNIAAASAESSPFKQSGVCQFVPGRVVERVSRQIGLFTLHNPSDLALGEGLRKDDKLEKIIIDAGYRSELLFELNQYGVNSQALFPNLVGLSRHFNWVSASFSYWAEGIIGLKDLR